MKEVIYEDFLRVFASTVKMPENKHQLMIDLFTFYKSGVKNENERIGQKLQNLIN